MLKLINATRKYDLTTRASFYKQPNCKGSNIKNGLKFKQVAKQPPTLKRIMQKNLIGL